MFVWGWWVLGLVCGVVGVGVCVVLGVWFWWVVVGFLVWGCWWFVVGCFGFVGFFFVVGFLGFVGLGVALSSF
ncbi:hypothetical protein, partial [Acinetobacter baumannii]